MTEPVTFLSNGQRQLPLFSSQEWGKPQMRLLGVFRVVTPCRAACVWRLILYCHLSIIAINKYPLLRSCLTPFQVHMFVFSVIAMVTGTGSKLNRSHCFHSVRDPEKRFKVSAPRSHCSVLAP